MTNKKYVRITTIILSGMILLKIISIIVLLCTPLHERSVLADLIIDIYSEYPTSFVFLNIPFPILYIYWGVRRKIEKGYAFNGALFSILQIPLGFIAFIFSITHSF